MSLYVTSQTTHNLTVNVLLISSDVQVGQEALPDKLTGPGGSVRGSRVWQRNRLRPRQRTSFIKLRSFLKVIENGTSWSLTDVSRLVPFFPSLFNQKLKGGTTKQVNLYPSKSLHKEVGQGDKGTRVFTFPSVGTSGGQSVGEKCSPSVPDTTWFTFTFCTEIVRKTLVPFDHRTYVGDTPSHNMTSGVLGREEVQILIN